jgi:hypothetical protein
MASRPCDGSRQGDYATVCGERCQKCGQTEEIWNSYTRVAWQPIGNGADVPSSAQKAVRERYSVSDDGSTLTVEYTIADLMYLTEPYTSRVELTRVPEGTQMYPYDCDVESAGMWSRTIGDNRCESEPNSDLAMKNRTLVSAAQVQLRLEVLRDPRP